MWEFKNYRDYDETLLFMPIFPLIHHPLQYRITDVVSHVNVVVYYKQTHQLIICSYHSNIIFISYFLHISKFLFLIIRNHYITFCQQVLSSVILYYMFILQKYWNIQLFRIAQIWKCNEWAMMSYDVIPVLAQVLCYAFSLLPFLFV